MLDTRRPALLGIPASHQLDALVFASGEPVLSEVIVAGAVRLTNGRHPDEAAIAGNFESAMQALWRSD